MKTILILVAVFFMSVSSKPEDVFASGNTYPHIMRQSEIINRGCEVYVKRMPGIGTSKLLKDWERKTMKTAAGEDFFKTSDFHSMKGWDERIDASLTALARRMAKNATGGDFSRRIALIAAFPLVGDGDFFYPVTYILGRVKHLHSMGGDFLFITVDFHYENIISQYVRNPKAYGEFMKSLIVGDIDTAQALIHSITDEYIHDVYKKCEDRLQGNISIIRRVK